MSLVFHLLNFHLIFCFCSPSISIDRFTSSPDFKKTGGFFAFPMPGGVPVATVALNGAKNAGILAAQIIGASDKCVLDKVLVYKKGLKTKVLEASKKINR